MDEITNDFYVTLPSNSSMEYFPQNTQSSYRTKLISPLMLGDRYECALSEIFFPRNWFNIIDQNNGYTIYLKSSKEEIAGLIEYQITFVYDTNISMNKFFENLNEKIRIAIGNEESVHFVSDANGENVTMAISEGFEVHISKVMASKFLYILHLPNDDVIIRETVTFKSRGTTDDHPQVFTIVNKNPVKEIKHTIPLTMKGMNRNRVAEENVFSSIQKNIEWLQLQTHIEFKHDPIRHALNIIVAENAELHINEKNAHSLLRMLHKEGDIIVRGSQKFLINPLITLRPDENVELIIKDYHKVIKYETLEKELFINEGSYNSAEELFREFQYIQLKLLPNQKVHLKVPNNCEVRFSKGLADMLGFFKTDFGSGVYSSKYPLELNAGITEIFVYTDLIESHHVGDTHVPLLRIIPCMNEKNDQIVKHYETPIYFPVRKHFVDTIEIELKTSSGRSIIFTGGKTFVVLSFRRKRKGIN